MKTTFYNSRFNERTFPVIVITDHVSGDLNIGSLFRVCDAFGVEKLIVSAYSPPLGRKARRASRSTENAVEHEFCDDALFRIKDLKTEGYRVICLEVTTDSTPIHKMKFSFDKPIALVVGDERYGISDEILELSDQIVHIEMFGRNSSMNVMQATNIALYEITRQQL